MAPREAIPDLSPEAPLPALRAVPATRGRTARLGRLAPDAIVLGIDPGTRVLGFGAVVVGRSRSRFLRAGVVRPPARLDLASRLFFRFAFFASNFRFS